MLNSGLFTSATDQHWTPDTLLDAVRSFYTGNFFDPCPRGVPSFDGLSIPWQSDVFCNPPYGRMIGRWSQKAYAEYIEGAAYQVLLLVPARTDTRWMQPLLERFPVCFVRGRLRFGEARSSAPFPSALIYMGHDNDRFREYFAPWGVLVNCRSKNAD